MDLGPELSRGFRALKVWMALRVHGADRLGAAAERCVALAVRLAARVGAEPALEVVAPVAFNVVCFRVRGLGDAGHAAVAAEVAERGGPVLSTARVGGRVALRACVCNHRTAEAGMDAVAPAVLAAVPAAVLDEAWRRRGEGRARCRSGWRGWWRGSGRRRGSSRWC